MLQYARSTEPDANAMEAYANTTPNVVMTAALMASLPTVLLFLLLRRHFMNGLKLQSL